MTDELFDRVSAVSGETSRQLRRCAAAAEVMARELHEAGLLSQARTLERLSAVLRGLERDTAEVCRDYRGVTGEFRAVDLD